MSWLIHIKLEYSGNGQLFNFSNLIHLFLEKHLKMGMCHLSFLNHLIELMSRASVQTHKILGIVIIKY